MKRLFLILSFSLLLTAGAQAASKTGYDFNTSSGLDTIAQETGHKTLTVFQNLHTPQAVIAQVLHIALGLLGIIFMCYTIYAGYIWMMARESASEAERAQKILKNAVIGMIIVAFAYGITSFVMKNFDINKTYTADNNTAESDTGAAEHTGAGLSE